MVEDIQTPNSVILQNTIPATMIASTASVTMDPPTAQPLQSGVGYIFTVTTVNSLPNTSKLWLRIPAAIGMPSNVNSLTATCMNTACFITSPNFTWNSSTRVLEFTVNHFTSLPSGSQLSFEVKGFINPANTMPQVFDFGTDVMINNIQYQCD
jgi:hypothetical protein